MTKINRKTGDNNPMLLFEDAFLQVKNEIEKALKLMDEYFNLNK